MITSESGVTMTDTKNNNKMLIIEKMADILMDEANAEIEQLQKEIEQLRQERDEARREVCNMNETGLRMNESDKKREAKRRGWDCFKD